MTALRPNPLELTALDGGGGSEGDNDVMHKGTTTSVLAFQAAAAKMVGILARESDTLADVMMKLQVVGHLMHAMSNERNLDGQKQATTSLFVLLDVCPYAVAHVEQVLGDELFGLLRTHGPSLCQRFTPVQVELLTAGAAVTLTIEEAAD